jgi:hypothetical protein
VLLAEQLPSLMTSPSFACTIAGAPISTTALDRQLSAKPKDGSTFLLSFIIVTNR